MRTWLRGVGLALVAVALALDVALLVYDDPASLPGPVGQVAGEYVMPWANDAVLPWVVRLGVVQLAVAGEPEATAVDAYVPTPDPFEEASPSPTPESSAGVSPLPTPSAATAVALDDPTPTASPTAAPTATPVAVPVRLQASAIGLDAPIVPVSVDRAGAMGTPRTAGEVGWYGPRPGEQGNALLAGHVDWLVNGQATTGSFYLLNRLNAGDLVTVRTADNTTLRFRVDWRRYYQAATAPVDEITGATVQPSITLITCGGPFDRTLRSYVGRWVVRATLVEGQ